ncbi:oxidoreductase [Glonium stellatum]|uniref:Oxidoreductase n=1 Tax=Glonium stellatum TaxID=574774 RepID=A0A8E2JM65_9PEZI|nr:oxidoreductase [Glonium stellatum]
MGGIKYDPGEDIPELTGKVMFITGGTAGIGSESILLLAKHNPEHIYFSGRNSTAAEALTTKVKATSPNAALTFVQCDQGSLASIKSAVEQQFKHKRLDILICNTGIMDKPPGLTTDGYEIQFGLLPIMLQTAAEPDSDVRIIMLTSLAFKIHPTSGIVFKDLKTTQPYRAFGGTLRYGQSKLAALVYARELARRYPSITSVAIHPGVVQTSLVTDLSATHKAVVYISQLGKLLTPEQGAYTYNQVWAAVGDKPKGKPENGVFYEPVGMPGKLNTQAKNQKLASELWRWTEKELDAW